MNLLHLLLTSLIAPITTVTILPDISAQATRNTTPPSFTPNHIGISCHDVPSQIKWYGDVLGFNKIVLNYTALIPLFHTVQVMNAGGAVIELQKHANSTRLPENSLLNPLDRAVYEGIFHFALKVEDLNSTFNYLQGKGVNIISPPSCVRGIGCSGFVSDPEGNIVELVHYLLN